MKGQRGKLEKKRGRNGEGKEWREGGRERKIRGVRDGKV